MTKVILMPMTRRQSSPLRSMCFHGHCRKCRLHQLLQPACHLSRRQKALPWGCCTPANQQTAVLAGLLSGEAFDIVADSKLLENEVTTETFSAVRRLLASPGLPACHARYQYPWETIRTYVRELQSMVDIAYENETADECEKLVFVQLLEGIQTPSTKREFLRYPPRRLDAALETGDHLEEIDAAIGTPTSGCFALRGNTRPRRVLPERMTGNPDRLQRYPASQRPAPSGFRWPRRQTSYRGSSRYRNTPVWSSILKSLRRKRLYMTWIFILAQEQVDVDQTRSICKRVDGSGCTRVRLARNCDPDFSSLFASFSLWAY
ncbi:unnamed protein product [Dicrocoelium dendriticum]|nr:unnamed protein product [Dicrocoelium dendriticum]